MDKAKRAKFEGKYGMRIILATELLAMQFCIVPWCERERDASHEHFCSYHAREEQRHEADMLSIDDPPESTGLSLRFQILKRDSYRCRLCGVAVRDGEHVRLEVDHITPRSKGGSNDESNLWTLCFQCNRGKGSQELWSPQTHILY